MLPLVILLQVLFTAGFCMMLAVLGVYFVEISNIMGHVLRMWYFLSPGLYSMQQVPESLRLVFRLNPFSELMTSYRDILIRGQMPSTFDLGYAFLIGAVFYLAGFFLFKRYEGRIVQRL